MKSVLDMTLEEFKTDWREKEKLPKDPNLKVTCLCGKCQIDTEPASDEVIEAIYNIVHAEF